jgi:uncharacterized membrane protein
MVLYCEPVPRYSASVLSFFIGGIDVRTNSTKRMVLYGLLIALVFLATYFTKIPTPLPGGYFNLGDSVIILAAAFLGPIGGLAAGSVGSALADLAYGGILFAPITFVVKGIEGLTVGLLISKMHRAGGLKHSRLIAAVAAGAFIMVAGYFLAEAFLLGIFDEAFGLTAAAGELPANSVQGILSAVLGYILTLILTRTGIDKYLDS